VHVLLQSYNWATSVPFVLDNKEGRSIGCFSVTTEIAVRFQLLLPHAQLYCSNVGIVFKRLTLR